MDEFYVDELGDVNLVPDTKQYSLEVFAVSNQHLVKLFRSEANYVGQMVIDAAASGINLNPPPVKELPTQFEISNLQVVPNSKVLRGGIVENFQTVRNSLVIYGGIVGNFQNFISPYATPVKFLLSNFINGR